MFWQQKQKKVLTCWGITPPSAEEKNMSPQLFDFLRVNWDKDRITPRRQSQIFKHSSIKLC